MACARHVSRAFVAAELAVGDTFVLGDDKRHHLAVVLRVAAGDAVTLFNGDGAEYGARVVEATRKRLAVEIIDRHTPTRESALDLTLYQAIARSNRMDFALAKAVELGVTRIRPVFTARGQVKLDGARLEKKQAHWQAIVESAAEQSGRLICPEVAMPVPLSQIINPQNEGETALRLMLAPEAGHGVSAIARAERVHLLVGPESGLADAEIERATANGWQSFTLGPRVLRTETAGMAALTALQTLWGDLAS